MSGYVGGILQKMEKYKQLQVAREEPFRGINALSLT
jgi:hypothetical protein